MAGAFRVRPAYRDLVKDAHIVLVDDVLTTGATVAEVESWPERIEAVTVEHVNAAAKAVFDERRSATGVLLPKPTS